MSYLYQVLVCGGTGCEATKADDVYKRLTKELETRGMEKEVNIIKTGCFGFCEKGPVLKIMPDIVYYVKVKPDDIVEIINEHFIKGNIIERLKFEPEGEKTEDGDISFYKGQERVVLRNCGITNLDDIKDYIAVDGYKALDKALFEMKPDDVIEELKKSGLRGRGGGGFNTWMKWKFSKSTEAEKKYVVCNADEGDPGAFMDRSVIEGDPHSIIEGMSLCAYTIGATQGYVYVRVEYGLAIERLKKAIEQAYEYGLLGKNILGSDFSFDLDIRLGAGAFVCGEETALLASIEGKRGTPVPRPPYPSIKGLWGYPTTINNVETLASISPILLRGGEWYSKIGTPTSKGTKVFCLTGKVANSVLVEVPMGTTLKDIVFGVGGGVANGKKFKAVQTGGPSGGVIPEEYLDTPIDYENLRKLGSMMGSGGMIVMDEDDCMIDISKFYLGFCVDESCGKCAPCRIGGQQMLNILERISNGKGELEDIERLKKISLAMQKASLCGLGQSAPNPILSTINYFEEEYREHIIDKKCRAHKCKSLISYTINQNKCTRCRLCVKNCPVNAIPGDKEQGFWIDQEACIKCMNCYNVCPFGAVDRN
jgi:NADH:ubiquinone oxidoreductase subunit F (NADH-binding)/(2Fe-2S) ferredoxin